MGGIGVGMGEGEDRDEGKESSREGERAREREDSEGIQVNGHRSVGARLKGFVLVLLHLGDRDVVEGLHLPWRARRAVSLLHWLVGRLARAGAAHSHAKPTATRGCAKRGRSRGRPKATGCRGWGAKRSGGSTKAAEAARGRGGRAEGGGGCGRAEWVCAAPERRGLRLGCEGV